MARLKGGLFTSTLDISKRAPLDSREMVTKYEDLINPSIWKTNTSKTDALYNGLCVSVSEVGENMGKYFLIDRKAITEENYNNYLIVKLNNGDVAPFFQMWRRMFMATDQVSSINELVNNISANTSQITNILNHLKSYDDILAGIGGKGEPKTVLEAIKTISYTLPIATISTLGGIKSASDVDLNNIVTIATNKIYVDPNTGIGEVRQISTDILVNGREDLIFFGGSSQ